MVRIGKIKEVKRLQGLEELFLWRFSPRGRENGVG